MGGHGREIEGGGFAILPYCDVVYTTVQLRARERERPRGEREAACNLDASRAREEGEGEGRERSQDSEGVARVGPSVAGVAIKYNFRGVGLIPRIPRKYFIYYLHFVDT